MVQKETEAETSEMAFHHQHHESGADLFAWDVRAEAEAARDAAIAAGHADATVVGYNEDGTDLGDALWCVEDDGSFLRVAGEHDEPDFPGFFWYGVY